jgi:membrane protein
MKKSKLFLSIVSASLLSACVQINTAPQPTTTTSAAQTTQSNQTTTNLTTQQATTNTNQSAAQSSTSYKDSVQKMLEVFTNQYSLLDITKVQLKTVQPIVYEISALDDTTEYEFIYQVDSQNLVQTEMDRKKGDISYKRAYKKIETSILSDVDEIISIALGQFSGGQLKDWSLERDNGQLYWNIEVYHNGKSMEVTIDATSKQIVKIDD